MNLKKFAKAKLPSTLEPYECTNLLRIGKPNDGGYVINHSDVLEATILVSFGINTDWSFEESFVSLKKVRIYAYDGSVSIFLFIRQAIGLFLRRKPIMACTKMLSWFNFKKFFKGSFIFTKKYVSYERTSDALTIDEILKKYENERVFLKCDIEGMEYRLIDKISSANFICGIVIEFHDCDLHINRILQFISKTDLKVVSINANNCASLGLELIPISLEITLSKNVSTDLKNPKLCESINQENEPNNPKIEIEYSDI